MQNNSFTFTKEAIDKITPPAFTRDNKGKVIRPEIVQHVYIDTKEKGLVLNVSYLGTKSFFLSKKINGTRYKMKIGTFPEMSVVKARTEVAKLKNQFANGVNSDTEVIVEDNEMTFGQLHDKFIDHAKNKNTTWERDAKLIKKKAEHFYDKKLSTIQRDDIQKSFNNCINHQATNPLRTGRILANRCLSNIRTVFNKGIAWGWEAQLLKVKNYNILQPKITHK